MMKHSVIKSCWFAGLLALSAASGCDHAFVVQTPAGFVDLEDEHDDYDYRATTAEGLVIAVREIEHEPTGTLAFWAKSVEKHMRRRGGYALLESVKVSSGDGVEGVQLRFGHDDASQRPHLYYVTIFSTDAHIQLIEVGGSKEQVEAQKSQIASLISGFRTQ